MFSAVGCLNACLCLTTRLLQFIQGQACYGCINHAIHQTYGKRFSTLRVLNLGPFHQGASLFFLIVVLRPTIRHFKVYFKVRHVMGVSIMT